MKLSIIIPVRNEEFLIKKIIDQLQSKLKIPSYEIIFINDFSTDNTVKITQELIKNSSQINIYSNKRKGLGGAITEGINRTTGDIICIMMSDLSDSIDDLESYYKIISDENVDAVFGSRFIEGSKVIEYPKKKLILNRIFNLITKLIFFSDYNDFTNAFKIYKKSVLPIIPYTDEYVKLNDTKGIDKRQLGKTASKKQKFLTHEQLERIINHNSKHRHKSSLAQVINVLLPSTVLTGLRPSEWFNAMIRQCAGRLTLIVRTDKLYKEAQARLGVDKDKDMTLFIPYRGIPLDHLDEHDVQRIRATIGIMNDINKSERNNREFLDELAKNLRTTVLDIWSREERPDIAIYSARHQFIANMKASKIEDATITYLAGQIYEETKHRHYASKLKGEVTTTPYNVEEIMQFVKTEINSRFQGDVS